MAAKKGLGKGLDSLIAPKAEPKKASAGKAAGEKPVSEHAADAVMLDIAKVEPNRDQPRKKFDEDALDKGSAVYAYTALRWLEEHK